MRFIFVILSFDLLMSSRIDHANREKGQDQSFILQAINNTLQVWSFKRMTCEIVLNKIKRG